MVSVSTDPIRSLHSAIEEGSVEYVDLTHPLSEATPIIELPSEGRETELRGYGVEQIGIDMGLAHELDPPWPAHHYLLGAGKFELAQLANLDRLPPTGSLLIPAPLKIVRGSGTPMHVIALVPAA